MAEASTRKPSRIQQRNRKRILDAALEVFSRHGYRGATLDLIAEEAGLSKPNILSLMLWDFSGTAFRAVFCLLLLALCTRL